MKRIYVYKGKTFFYQEKVSMVKYHGLSEDTILDENSDPKEGAVLVYLENGVIEHVGLSQEQTETIYEYYKAKLDE